VATAADFASHATILGHPNAPWGSAFIGSIHAKAFTEAYRDGAGPWNEAIGGEIQADKYVASRAFTLLRRQFTAYDFAGGQQAQYRPRDYQPSGAPAPDLAPLVSARYTNARIFGPGELQAWVSRMYDNWLAHANPHGNPGALVNIRDRISSPYDWDLGSVQWGGQLPNVIADVEVETAFRPSPFPIAALDAQYPRRRSWGVSYTFNPYVMVDTGTVGLAREARVFDPPDFFFRARYVQQRSFCSISLDSIPDGAEIVKISVIGRAGLHSLPPPTIHLPQALYVDATLMWDYWSNTHNEVHYEEDNVADTYKINYGWGIVGEPILRPDGASQASAALNSGEVIVPSAQTGKKYVWSTAADRNRGGSDLNRRAVILSVASAADWATRGWHQHDTVVSGLDALVDFSLRLHPPQRYLGVGGWSSPSPGIRRKNFQGEWGPQGVLDDPALQRDARKRSYQLMIHLGYDYDTALAIFPGVQDPAFEAAVTVEITKIVVEYVWDGVSGDEAPVHRPGYHVAVFGYPTDEVTNANDGGSVSPLLGEVHIKGW